jgi:hypothetical protein
VAKDNMEPKPKLGRLDVPLRAPASPAQRFLGEASEGAAEAPSDDLVGLTPQERWDVKVLVLGLVGLAPHLG